MNFDDRQVSFGSLTRSMVDDMLGYRSQYLIGGDDLAIENGYLRQRYVATSRGSSRVEFRTRDMPGADEMWLSYRVFLEPGFEFVRGGKLPGLAGGDVPSGGRPSDEGFSARLMWRENNRLVVYAYHPDQPKNYGEDFDISGTVPVGEWLQITQRVKVNSSPNARDGVVEVWINGERRLSRTDLRWRTSTEVDVDGFIYSSFYGGADPSWSPSRTTYARFDDFKVGTSADAVDR